jgi:hypothetical protein
MKNLHCSDSPFATTKTSGNERRRKAVDPDATYRRHDGHTEEYRLPRTVLYSHASHEPEVSLRPPVNVLQSHLLNLTEQVVTAGTATHGRPREHPKQLEGDVCISDTLNQEQTKSSQYESQEWNNINCAVEQKVIEPPYEVKLQVKDGPEYKDQVRGPSGARTSNQEDSSSNMDGPIFKDQVNSRSAVAILARGTSPSPYTGEIYGRGSATTNDVSISGQIPCVSAQLILESETFPSYQKTRESQIKKNDLDETKRFWIKILLLVVLLNTILVGAIVVGGFCASGRCKSLTGQDGTLQEHKNVTAFPITLSPTLAETTNPTERTGTPTTMPPETIQPSLPTTMPPETIQPSLPNTMPPETIQPSLPNTMPLETTQPSQCSTVNESSAICLHDNPDCSLCLQENISIEGETNCTSIASEICSALIDSCTECSNCLQLLFDYFNCVFEEDCGPNFLPCAEKEPIKEQRPPFPPFLPPDLPETFLPTPSTTSMPVETRSPQDQNPVTTVNKVEDSSSPLMIVLLVCCAVVGEIIISLGVYYYYRRAKIKKTVQDGELPSNTRSDNGQQNQEHSCELNQNDPSPSNQPMNNVPFFDETEVSDINNDATGDEDFSDHDIYPFTVVSHHGNEYAEF